jgi:hypothetical protein
MKTHLVLRYCIWSMLIFAVSMLLLSIRGLRSFELRLIGFGPQGRVISLMKTSSMADVPSMMLPLYEQLSQDEFLEAAVDITHSLKKAGAKVVIVPVLDNIRPTLRNENSIREILRDSIAIFAVSKSIYYSYFTSEPSLDDREQWWIRHPFFHRLNMPWGVLSDNTTSYGLIRFIPEGMRDFDSGEPVPDIRVLALRRYFDIPDNEEFPVSVSGVQIGSSAFPIERDGLTYVPYRVSNRNWGEIYASLKPGSDSVSYFYSAVSRQTGNKPDLDKAWKAYKGKIVYIDAYISGASRWPSRGWTSMLLFSSFFDRSFIRVHNEWNVLLVTTLVILLSVVSYTIRNGLMVFLSLLLTVAAVAISTWLFISHNILFEPIYCIVPILLCGCILPIVKLSGEKRIAEERSKSLEEENRRLQELQKSASHGTNF